MCNSWVAIKLLTRGINAILKAASIFTTIDVAGILDAALRTAVEIRCVKFIGSSLIGKETDDTEENMGISTLVSIVEFGSCKTCKGADRKLVFASLYSG